MMTVVDEWGRDPAVKAMRKIFKVMDDAQRELFTRMEIHRYDPRIRPWREKALVLFERAFSHANRAGMSVNEKTASDIYIYCLTHLMRASGVEISDTNLPDRAGIENVLKEIL